MVLDRRLLDVLVCPKCRGPVEHVEAEDLIVCRGDCRLRYPVREGIPVLLIDDALAPEDGPGS